MATRIIATITFDTETEDDEGLDIECADIHAALDQVVLDEGWEGGKIELSLTSVPPQEPDDD